MFLFFSLDVIRTHRLFYGWKTQTLYQQHTASITHLLRKALLRAQALLHLESLSNTEPALVLPQPKVVAMTAGRITAMMQPTSLR